MGSILHDWKNFADSILGKILVPKSSPPGQVTEVVLEVKEKVAPVLASQMAGSNFVRVAGLSGGLAVLMSAYGAHAFNHADPSDEDAVRVKNVFDSGNKMHLIHSVALLGVPLCRRPKLVGSVMFTGMVIFSGTCYYQALTGDRRVRVATPYGGVLLILSWFLMIL